MESRLQAMEKRMVRNYLASGIGMLVVSPGVFFLSSILGIVLAVAGILSIIRAATLSDRSKVPPADPR